MPLSAHAILTMDEAKDYLGGREKWDPKNEDLLQGDATNPGWINIITQVIEEDYICNKVGSQVISARELFGNGSRYLELPYFPIIDLAETDGDKLNSLRQRSSWNGAWSNLLTSATQYTIDPDRPWLLELVDGSYFPAESEFRNLQVSWIAGYATIPYPIKKVAMEMLQIMYEESRKSGIGRLGRQSSADTNSGLTTTFESMRSRWLRDLAPYRKLID